MTIRDPRRWPGAIGACVFACTVQARTAAPTPPDAAASAAPSAAAPAAAVPALAPTPAPAQLRRVEITGTRPGDTQERRESTAAKIVIGRDEIDRFGDSSLGDVLKRLPGITLQGRPGHGGAIRMRGLGSGYTQILLDGQRVAPGFSIDSMTPEQVERIEILRAPTAETGARAIAGSINIVTREGFRKSLNEVRLIAAVEDGRVQPSVSWSRNDTLGDFIYNYSLTAFGRSPQSDTTTVTTGRNLADDSLLLAQREDHAVRDQRRGVHATGRLQWRGEQGVHAVTLIPLLIHSTGTTTRRSTLRQSAGAVPATYDASATDGDGSFSLARLNAHWNHRLDATRRLEWKLGVGRNRNASASLRTESETAAGAPTRTLDDRSATRDRNLLASAKWLQTVAGAHSLVAGVEGESNRRTEQRETLQDGAPLLVDFGANLGARSTRFAAFAQDEWNLTPQWAAHAGLRWEGIATQGDPSPGQAMTRNRSSVWSPLLHALWKPAPESRDQVRMSLTRSYRSPTLQNLIARPRIDSRYPVPGANTPTQPDRAGNPGLRPELATGLDIALERYPQGGGILGANVFYRRIKDYMRSRTQLEDVSWSPGQPRYVARTQNIGEATTQGIELEAKGRLSDVWADAPKIDLRANASVFRSRVKGVPGPDNRLDQQPDYTANLGADYRIPGTPLTLGGSFNLTPAYDTRISQTQTAYQGRKRVIDAYGLWLFGPSAQLRLTASNLAPRDYLSGGSVDDTSPGVNSRETSMTTAPTSLNVQVRLELKL